MPKIARRADLHGRRGAVYRLALMLIASASLILLAWISSFAGLVRCHDGFLPGDAGWTLRFLAREALSLLFGGTARGCLVAEGTALIQLAPTLAAASAALLVGAVLWEAFGWRLRLWLLARQGGHAVLAGETEGLRRLSGRRSRIWLAPDDARFPGLGALFRQRVPIPGLANEAEDAARLGLGRAALLIAATADDLTNFRLARAALAAGFAGRLVVQLDGRALRAFAADALRGAKGRAEIVIAAPGVIQARTALHLAMPGAYVDETDGLAGPRRFAICGDGPDLDPLVELLARQGYGLETAVPQLAVLRVGVAKEHRAEAPVPEDVLQISRVDVPQDDPGRLDGAIARLVSEGRRFAAIFCIGSAPGLAGLLASRWERVLNDLGRTVPPLVLMEAEFATSGLARIAPQPGLAEVEAWQSRLDARAEQLHAHYLALVSGTGPETTPTRRPWTELSEPAREDNRAAADHMGYKLALCGMIARPLREGMASLTPEDIDRLARVEHARWCAARLVAGWRLGPRDDAALRHPDLLPYDQLDEAAKDKDRDQVARLPAVLALGGEGILRLWPVRPGGGMLDPKDRLEKVITALQALARQRPDMLPMVSLRLDDADLALARGVNREGFPVELVLSDADGASTALAVAFRPLAERIRVVADPGKRALQTPALLTETGAFNALDPA